MIIMHRAYWAADACAITHILTSESLYYRQLRGENNVVVDPCILKHAYIKLCKLYRVALYSKINNHIQTLL